MNDFPDWGAITPENVSAKMPKLLEDAEAAVSVVEAANPETYEDTELTGIIPDQDFRRTLLWEPNLTTDADGKVSFQVMVNSTCREMYYSAEGITADGRAVVSR